MIRPSTRRVSRMQSLPAHTNGSVKAAMMSPVDDAPTPEGLRQKLQDCVRRMSEEKSGLIEKLRSPLFDGVISPELREEISGALSSCVCRLDVFLDRSGNRIVPFAPSQEFGN